MYQPLDVRSQLHAVLLDQCDRGVDGDCQLRRDQRLRDRLEAHVAPEHGSIFRALLGACRRRTPKGCIRSDGGIGKILVRRVFRCPQIDAGPRRAPSACSEKLKKKRARQREGRLVRLRSHDLYIPVSKIGNWYCNRYCNCFCDLAL